MAISLRGLLRTNFKFITGNVLKPVTNNATRPLYSANALAIDSYAEVRKTISNQFQAVSQTFRSKMAEFTQEDNKSLIFTEDLKAMLHILENNETDLELIKKMIKKFHSQNSELRFGNYVFGPVAMRAFFFLDAPDVAIELFKDPELQGFFEQLTSYQILLTLLYNHDRFDDMKDVYNLIKSKYTGGVIHPHNSVLLVLGACYKQNTPESFDFALNVWKETTKTGFDPSRKCVTLIAALALKQKKPEFALELISSCPRFGHIEVRCIKLQAFIELNRFDDVYNLLRRLSQSQKFIQDNQRPLSFFQDTFENIAQAVNRDGPEKHQELVQLLQEMKNQNLVQNNTLESSLLRVMERRTIRSKSEETSGTNTGRFNNRNAQQNRVTMKY